jgi:hypothetical protein
MTSHALAFAVLLMTAANIQSEPSAAVQLATPAYAGPDLAAGVVDSPLDVPGPAIAVPTSRMSPSPLDRGIAPLEFEQLVSSYATVAHLSDGTTTVTPASAALRAALQLEYDSGSI